MTGFGALLRKEILEQWRTMRLPLVAIVFLLAGLLSPLIARYTPEIVEAVGGSQFHITVPTPTAGDAVDQLLKNLGQLGALTAILLAMGSVASEKERGTAAMILSKPASRAAFLGAKLVAIAATLGIATFVAGAAAWFYTTVLFEALPVPGFLAATALEWLALVAFASVTFLGSTLTRSTAAAAGFGIAAFLVLGILSALPTVGRYLPTGLGPSARALALGAPAADVAGPVVATLALVTGVVAIAWLSFRRQEL